MKIFKKWWYFIGKYTHLNFIQGIKNLFKWFKIVWNDRDFDYVFILYILKFKLENIAKNIEKYSRHVGNERDVQRIKLCIRLLDKIGDGYYESEYQNYCNSDFNIRGDLSFQLLEKFNKNNLKTYLNKYPNQYRRIDKTNDDVLNALILGRLRHEKAKRLLFELLNRHVEEWWN